MTMPRSSFDGLVDTRCVAAAHSLPSEHRASVAAVVRASTMSSPCSRRSLLRAGGVGLAALLLPEAAEASVFRALSIEALVGASERVSLVNALAAECHYQDIAGARRIVTDTRVRVERPIRGSTSESELMVRTLGGIVGNQGERVDGEAALVLGESALLFLLRLEDGEHGVVGMAQGHYPLRADGSGLRRLRLSPRLPPVVRANGVPASARLAGLAIDAAAQLIREARP